MSRFHVELRQFPHTARAFNLTEAELRGRIVGPWLAGRPVLWGEREFIPGKAKLTVLSGPELPAHQLGMGRGWQQAQRSAEDVTATWLTPSRPAAAQLGELRDELLRAAAEREVTLADAVQIAIRRQSAAPVQDTARAAEQAVAELLREGLLVLRRPS